MSLIPVLVQELLRIFVGGPKRPPPCGIGSRFINDRHESDDSGLRTRCVGGRPEVSRDMRI